MEQYNKPPLTYQQQIDLLIRRGLIIANQEKAEQFLTQVNYYRLSAYCVPFERTRHQFHEDVTFEKIQQLYEFDRRLRFLIDEVLEVIEISFRTALSYYLTHRYNVFVQEDVQRFYDKFNHKTWITKVHEETVRSKETFIEHYKSKYCGFPQLPLWMAGEVMSFGALSQLYHNLLRDDQIAIAREVGFHSSVLASWLHTFTYVRNICAHHSRIWNRELSIAIKVPKDNRWLNINTKRIGSVIFAINQFLDKLTIESQIKEDWRTEMTGLLSMPVDIPKFHESMGLPDKFMTHPLWKS